MKRFKKKVYEFSMILKEKFLFNHQKIQSNWELNGRKISHIRARARKYFPRIHCTLIISMEQKKQFFSSIIYYFPTKNQKKHKSIWLDHHHHGWWTWSFVSFYDSFAYLGEIIEFFDVACKDTAYAMKYWSTLLHL